MRLLAALACCHTRGFAKGVSRTVSPRFLLKTKRKKKEEKRKKTETNGKNRNPKNYPKKRKNGKKGKNGKKRKKTEEIGSDTVPVTPCANPTYLHLLACLLAGLFVAHFRRKLKGVRERVGACAMTTKFLDNKICTFEMLLSWRFPRLAAFWDDFPLRPQPPPLRSANFIYIHTYIHTYIYML